MRENSKTVCNRYNSYMIKNETFLKITSAYEGIPQNVAINVVAYMILILLFILLRKKAWNYGELAWINKTLHLIPDSVNVVSESEEADEISISSKEPLNKKTHITLIEKFWKIIPLFIKMRDDELRQRCGSDAVIYCYFQRYLIITAVIMMFFSLTIILPLNLRGGFLNYSSEFSTLTIGNVKTNNPSLWIHFSVALVFMLLGFFISNCFLQKIDFKEKEELSSTIMIRNIPLKDCDELLLRDYFLETYNSLKIKRIQFAYKVNKLIYLYSQKVFAKKALEFCTNALENGEERVMVIPRPCGRLFSSKCCSNETCKPVDGMEFYSSEVIRYSVLFVEERSTIINKEKLPIVFVTFDNVHQACVLLKDYMYQNCHCLRSDDTSVSRVSKDLNALEWDVTFAPKSDDIIWENLHREGWSWWTPTILINVVVGIIVILLTTPSMVLTMMNKFNISQSLHNSRTPFLAQVIPSFVLVLVSSLMPTLVCWSVYWSGYWTNSNQNISIMNKLFAVLLTSVLILPSLGLNSIPEMIKWIFPETANTTQGPNKFRWECIFMPDGGALFCNYLITASFIGTALELLRFGELFIFSCKICYSKSRAEDKSIAQNVLWDFEFGLGYAWTLALFSVISAYAVVVPLITPFGLTYLVLKHLVDRYNMINVNIPSIVHYSVHNNAGHLMQVGLVLSQATVMVYVTLRRGIIDPLSIWCLMSFLLGIVLTFGRTIMWCIFNIPFIKFSFLKKHADRIGNVPRGSTIISEDEAALVTDQEENINFQPRCLIIETPSNLNEILSEKVKNLSLKSNKSESLIHSGKD